MMFTLRALFDMMCLLCLNHGANLLLMLCVCGCCWWYLCEQTVQLVGVFLLNAVSPQLYLYNFIDGEVCCRIILCDDYCSQNQRAQCRECSIMSVSELI